jgi:hypothetical protein
MRKAIHLQQPLKNKIPGNKLTKEDERPLQ